MRTLGNIIWHFPFFGFMSALGTFLLGGLLLITVIGAPIGLGLIQLSKFLLTPFSSAMVDKRDLGEHNNVAWGTFSLIIRIFYFPFGLFLAITTIVQVVGLFASIVGIPIAIVLAKSVSTYFNPVNKVCVAVEVRDELLRKKAMARVQK